MLFAYNNTTQNVAVDAPVIFNAIGIRTGNTATATVGGGNINLNRVGYYLINFNADVASTTGAGDVTIQMFSNNAEIAGAESTTSSTAATDIQNVSLSVIVRVLPNCCAMPNNTPDVITFRNTGVASTITNAAVTVTRLA